MTLSEKAMSYDRKWLFTLAIIGIPGAHGLHGYVGFVFGSLKSREWWSSDLMPVIFLLSAIISGTAFVIIFYVLSCKLRKVSIDLACMKIMAYALWGFMMFTLLIEGVEFLSLVYRGREGIDVILEFVKGPLIVPFFILQFGVRFRTAARRHHFPDLARHHRKSADCWNYRKRDPCSARGADDAL